MKDRFVGGGTCESSAMNDAIGKLLIKHNTRIIDEISLNGKVDISIEASPAYRGANPKRHLIAATIEY